MVSLEQDKIAQHLLDYANLNYLMLENPTESCKSLFEHYMNSNNRTEDYDKYYQEMINIYVLFIKMKSYCLCEDYNLKGDNNFIDNNKLQLLDIRKRIIKGNDYKDVSDKKLLQLIKDTFCHSSSDNPYYSISPNGRKVEIRIEKPHPITVQLNLNDIISLTGSMNNNTQTLQLYSMQFDTSLTDLKSYLKSFMINRYHFIKKMDEKIVDDIHDYSENNEHSNAIEMAKQQEQCTVKELELTDEQINHMISTINDLLRKQIITKEEYERYLPEIVSILINERFPLPIFKSFYYNIDSYMAHYLQSISGFSYNDMYKIVAKILPDKEEIEFGFEKHYKQLFKDQYEQLLFKIYYSNHGERLIHPYMMFIEYIITNYCCKTERIKIGKRNVETNKLRNSLVHAKWYIDDGKIRFYDSYTNIANELNYNWNVTLNFHELYNYCVETLEQVKKEKEETQKQKTIKIYS